MKTLLLFSTAFVASIAGTAQTISREVIASAGDYSVSSIGSLSWTVGETITETVQNGSIAIILTQGFQQPDKDSVVGIRQVMNSDVFVSLFPNPATHILNITVKYDSDTKIQMHLLDMLGRIIRNDELSVSGGNPSSHQIDVSGLASGMYMVRLTGEDGILGSYKWQRVE